MVEQYSQTIDVDVTKKSKLMQLAGIALVLASLGFLMVSVFFSWWFMFAFAALFALGCGFIHIYNKVAKEYTYELNRTTLTIVAKDVVNRQKRILTLYVKDIKGFSLMTGMFDSRQDILCCSNCYDMGVFEICFDFDGSNKRLLFAPDDYMVALINETIAQNNKVEY